MYAFEHNEQIFNTFNQTWVRLDVQVMKGRKSYGSKKDLQPFINDGTSIYCPYKKNIIISKHKLFPLFVLGTTLYIYMSALPFG